MCIRDRNKTKAATKSVISKCHFALKYEHIILYVHLYNNQAGSNINNNNNRKLNYKRLSYLLKRLELVRTKCTPILLYGLAWLGLECFQFGKADRHSLDFTFNRLCMKLFKTGSKRLSELLCYWSAELWSQKRQDKFILRYISTVNGFCQFCNKL